MLGDIFLMDFFHGLIYSIFIIFPNFGLIALNDIKILANAQHPKLVNNYVTLWLCMMGS